MRTDVKEEVARVSREVQCGRGDLHAYDDVPEARAGIGRYLRFFDGERASRGRTSKALSKACEHLGKVLRLSGIGFGDRCVQLAVESGTLVGLKIVVDYIIQELHAFGTIGSLIQNNPSVANMGSEWLRHRLEVYSW